MNSSDELPDLSHPRYASLWRNNKHGTLYLVTDVSIFEEDLDALVTYCQPRDPRQKWSRRRDVFYQKFTQWDWK